MLNSTNWHGYIGADFNTDKANINEIGFEFIRGQDDLSAQNPMVSTPLYQNICQFVKAYI